MKKNLASKPGTPSSSGFLIEEGDILGDLTEKKGSSLLLGRYSLAEVKAVLSRRNFLREARRRKLWPLEMRLVPAGSPNLQRLQIFHRKTDPDCLIVDLKVREGYFKPEEVMNLAVPPSGFFLLILEWLTLQNPLLTFSPDRPPLPGQNRPGLGLGQKVMDQFIYLARINRNDGILAFPAFFHNARLFSRRFHFINPDKEAEVFAIVKTFPRIPFKILSWIVHLGCLIEEGRGIFEWKAAEQICPINRELVKYFQSPGYRKSVRAAQEKRRFRIDWDRFHLRENEIGPEMWPDEAAPA